MIDINPSTVMASRRPEAQPEGVITDEMVERAGQGLLDTFPDYVLDRIDAEMAEAARREMEGSDDQ